MFDSSSTSRNALVKDNPLSPKGRFNRLSYLGWYGLLTIVYLANPSLSRDDILYAIADELRRQADAFLDLNDLMTDFGRPKAAQ